MFRDIKPAAAIAALFLSTIPQVVLAQDADWQAQVEDAHQRYEAAIAEDDLDGLAAMFAEDAVYQPLTGGMLEGRDAIRQHFDEMGFAGMDVMSKRVDQVGENMVLDYGTFTVTLSEDMGGSTVDGEYVALAETGETVLIHSLSGFPMREGLSGQN